MKESNYNLYFDHGDKTYAFNAMTCALAEVDETYYSALKDIKAGNSDKVNDELLNSMQYGGFVIGSDVDEIKLLQVRSWQNKFSSSAFGLTIAPTLACNFACPYCYETAKPGVMSEEIADAILDLIKSHAEKKEDIQINWYGGEPLLALDFIEKLSQRLISVCRENSVSYSAYMISNGFLISSEVVSRLKACRVTGMQITIDGPRDIHDSRRIQKANRQGSFDKIVENVQLLISEELIPDIRINVDKSNSSRVGELLAFFKSKGMETCRISFGHVTAYTDACADIENTCLNVKEYADETIEYQKLLLENGFSAASYPLYPGIKGNYCCADNNNSFVVDPSGNLYKCWNDVGIESRSVANILEKDTVTDTQKMILADYLLWSPFKFTKCLKCKLLPICMGGCPYNGLRNMSEPECEKWKYNLEQALVFMIENEAKVSR